MFQTPKVKFCQIKNLIVQNRPVHMILVQQYQLCTNEFELALMTSTEYKITLKKCMDFHTLNSLMKDL